MPTFEFYGRDITGKLIVGKRIARTADSIGLQLISDGITPVSITLIHEYVHWWSKINDWSRRGRVTTDEMGMFARQMHTLCKAGVPITNALKRLAETSRSMRMTETLNGIAELLESGLDLAAAMQRYPKVFSPLMISMVRVGQSSGSLDEAFLRLNQYIELESNAIKRVAAATRYPAVIFSIMVIAMIVINTFVLPTFANVFERANIPLPLLTIVLMTISSFINHNWVYIVVVLGGSIGWTIHFLTRPEGKLFWGRNQLKIPVLGTILKRIVLLRFAQVFSIVINSGIPLLEGLALVSSATNNAYAEQEILLMRDAIQRGNSLTQAATSVNLFTPLEIQMLAVSEETGDIGAMFQQIGVYYQREVDYDLKRFNDFMEPALIIILAVMVLLLAFAVYLPIWNMVKLTHA